LHPPIDETAGFDTEEMITEGQVAILPAGHPLTTRTHLTMAQLDDLADLPRPRWPRPDGTYAEGPGPEIQNHAQLLQLIALHRTLMVAPDSCRSQLREDVVAVPVVDASPPYHRRRLATTQPISSRRRPRPNRHPPLTVSPTPVTPVPETGSG
jgi:hypothetical protein